jgi:uncharacterized protein (DUF1684 family)
LRNVPLPLKGAPVRFADLKRKELRPLRFSLGQTHHLDAIAENGGLFFVFRDATADDTTYGASRFIDIANQPPDNPSFTLDFNKAYNPPCAFSEFTTCPLPAKQNILKARIEAGEKYQKGHQERSVRASSSPKLN